MRWGVGGGLCHSRGRVSGNTLSSHFHLFLPELVVSYRSWVYVCVWNEGGGGGGGTVSASRNTLPSYDHVL